MEKNPKISVIVPIYNVQDYVSRCLESLVKQTLLDIEIICVNDGTKDDSIEIVKRYMDTDVRISLVEKKNGGLASARNAGLDVATGTIILFLDSDDYLADNACERIYEEYLNRAADIIVFGSTPFPDIPEPDAWVRYKLNCRDKYYPEFKPKVLFKEPCGEPFAWNRAFSHEFLVANQLRFREDVRFGEDIIFAFETMPLSGSVQFISDSLHFYQWFRQGSLMFRYNTDIEEKLQQHVNNMRIITEFWHEKGLIDKWGKYFFEWYVRFIVPDLIQQNPENKQQLAKEALSIMKHYGVWEWRNKVSLEIKEKTKRLCKMARA